MKALSATIALVLTAAAPLHPVIAARSDLPPTRFPFAAPPSAAMNPAEFAAMLPSIRETDDRAGPRMREAGIRVVNMSWGLTADEITQQLLDHKLESDAARAKTRGIAMQKTIGDALERLIRASPNILFVVAAGNSNQADAVQADAVQRLTFPNLMIVGATGANGRPTAFTVFGPSVAVYAQGEAVPLRWPGNLTVRMSGTSMAAPLVARAAAQMLAVNPRLTAAQVRAGLTETASAGDVRLLHPAAAVAWVTRR